MSKPVYNPFAKPGDPPYSGTPVASSLPGLVTSAQTNDTHPSLPTTQTKSASNVNTKNPFAANTFARGTTPFAVKNTDAVAQNLGKKSWLSGFSSNSIPAFATVVMPAGFTIKQAEPLRSDLPPLDVVAEGEENRRYFEAEKRRRGHDLRSEDIGGD